MPTNIEIKVRVENFASLLPVLAAVAHAEPDHLEQEDAFSTCPKGRLKIRVPRAGH